MNTENIRQHMKVVGSDRQPVGTVDDVDGDRIKLAKNDPEANGMHHYIPTDWIDTVDNEQVCLRQDADEVRRQWMDA
jgi:hypothetical protein